MDIKDLKDYKLVWSDEFDKDGLDANKWNLRQDEVPIKNSDKAITYDFSDEERVVKVEDGKLKLNVYYDEKRNCFIGPKSVQTKEKMSFTYGYVEIRARMPYTHASLPEITAFSKGAIGCEENADNYSQIDLLVVDGIYHLAYNRITKLYQNYDENHPLYKKDRNDNDNSLTAQAWGEISTDSYHAKYTDVVLDDFKTYGFLWTPTEMKFMVDGFVLTRINLTTDFLRESGMEMFHKPHYLEFHNYLTVDNEKHYHIKTNHATPEDAATQVPFEIDYVRLYQKEGEGQLNLAD